MKENKLSVAFVGQLYENEAGTTKYVYPHQEDTSWAGTFGSDPRSALTALGNVTKCYSIKVLSGCILYAYRTLVDRRGGSNTAMVILKADGPTIDGEKLAERLINLLEYAIKQDSKDQIKEDVIKEKLSGLEDLFDLERKPQSTLEEIHIRKGAYRIYSTNKELHNILQSPYQSAYKSFDCIHIVAKDENPQSSIQLIDSPLESSYVLRLPEGVEEKDGKSCVGEKESFELIYNKEGYLSYPTGSLYANKPSNFFSKNGDIISVKSAEDCKVVFLREVKVKVKDSLGNPVFKWQLIRDGGKPEKYNSDTAQGELPDKKINCQIKATGYYDKKFEWDTSVEAEKIVTLEAKGTSKKVFLIPAWPKKSKVHFRNEEPANISFSENSILYGQYKKLLDPDKRDNPTLYVSSKSPKKIVVFMSVLSLLVGICIGVFMGRLFCPNSNTETPEPNIPEKTNSGSCNIEKQVNEASNAQINSYDVVAFDPEQHDIEYLNNNYRWVSDSLQSKKYRYFFDTIVANKVQFKDVAWDEYNKITNRKWRNIYNIMKHATTTHKYDELQSLNYYDLRKQIGNTHELDLLLAVEKKQSKTVSQTSVDTDKQLTKRSQSSK